MKKFLCLHVYLLIKKQNKKQQNKKPITKASPNSDMQPHTEILYYFVLFVSFLYRIPLKNV